MRLEEFVKILKSHFGIACDATDEPYKVRFYGGDSYDEHDERNRAVTVMAHDRGKTTPLRVSPFLIKHVLAKFKITEQEFLEAHDLATNRVAPIRPTLPKMAEERPAGEPKKEAS